MNSIINHNGKEYGFVNEKNGYVAYRCTTNPKDELIFDSNGDVVLTDKSIKLFWRTI